MDTLETKLLDDAKRGATGVAMARTPAGTGIPIYHIYDTYPIYATYPSYDYIILMCLPRPILVHPMFSRSLPHVSLVPSYPHSSSVSS